MEKLQNWLDVSQKHYGNYDLLYYGYMDCTANWECDYPNGADDGGIIIHYIKGGQGILETAESVYELSKGDTFIMERDVPMYYRADAKEPWSYLWIALGGDYVQGLLENKKQTIQMPAFRLRNMKEVENCFNKLFSYIPSGGVDDDLFFNGVINMILYYTFDGEAVQPFSEKQFGRKSPSKDSEQHYIYLATGYIITNYNSEITVADIARHVNLDRSYFSKLFKKHTGIPPGEYITECRIKKAMYLLENTNDSVRNIASEVGFNYAHHFNDVFKRYTGKTPNQYRCDYRAGGAPPEPTYKRLSVSDSMREAIGTVE